MQVFVAFGFGLGFDFGGDAVVKHFDNVEEGEEVVDKAGAGKEVGNEVDGENEVAQHPDNEAFVLQWDMGVGEHIVEQQHVVDHLTASLGSNRFELG